MTLYNMAARSWLLMLQTGPCLRSRERRCVGNARGQRAMAADKRRKMTNAVDTTRSFDHYRVVIWIVRASGGDGRIA